MLQSAVKWSRQWYRGPTGVTTVQYNQERDTYEILSERPPGTLEVLNIQGMEDTEGHKITASDLKCVTCNYSWNTVMGLTCEMCKEHYVDMAITCVPTGICGNGHVACSQCLGRLWHTKRRMCPVGTCTGLVNSGLELTPQLQMIDSIREAQGTLDRCANHMKHAEDGGLYCYQHEPATGKWVTLKMVTKAIEHVEATEEEMLKQRTRIEKEVTALQKTYKQALGLRQKTVHAKSTLERLATPAGRMHALKTGMLELIRSWAE